MHCPRLRLYRVESPVDRVWRTQYHQVVHLRPANNNGCLVLYSGVLDRTDEEVSYQHVRSCSKVNHVILQSVVSLRPRSVEGVVGPKSSSQIAGPTAFVVHIELFLCRPRGPRRCVDGLENSLAHSS